MNIQPLHYNDVALLTELQPAGWGDILPTIACYTNTAFCFPMKATSDNKITGIGTAIIHNEVAWLAHIIVHPHYRNQGIGRFITQTLVDNVQAKNCDTIYLIATDLGEPVYRKIGFETETEYLFFKDIKADPDLVTADKIIAYTDDLKIPLARLDRQVTGEDRLFHLEEHLSDGYVYQHNNVMEGFYLPSFGEGLIIANTPSAGIELMKLRMTTKENAAFPVDNIKASTFMHQHNYHAFKRASRMRLGTKRAWEPAHLYNRIGGNLG
jgi:GNAT superfamily N-acetyltransferase